MNRPYGGWIKTAMVENLIKRRTPAVLAGLTPFAIICVMAATASAEGPFTAGSKYEPYTPVEMNSSEIVAWATGWVDPVSYGSNVDSQWKTPQKALGRAKGDAYDIVSLGRGGSITMTFDRPIRDGKGWDFAVFENSFSDDFLELAYVEVSSDGTWFIRFDNVSLTQRPVGGFGSVDYTLIHGLAGKYRQGVGTPFDLSDLLYKTEVKSGLVDLDSIRYVRIVDIVGDGTCYDNPPPGWGDRHIIYDPYPTTGSAGFDLDAIGVRYQANVRTKRIDINGDGVSNLADAIVGLQVLLGYKPNIREDRAAADINGDGKVGLAEVLYILQFESEQDM